MNQQAIDTEPTACLTAKGARTVPVLTGVNVRGTLRGTLLDMHIEQHYRNDAATNIEAVYTFPLAFDAVLLGLEVELNGRTLTGIAVARQEAEQKYEEAIARGDSAIMLERSGDGLYTTNLGNLMPGETAVIRFRYAQAMACAQGSIRLVVPTVIAPRYGDAEKQSRLRAGAVPKTNLLASYPLNVTLDIAPPLAACDIDSPSHPLARQTLEDGTLRLSLARKGQLDRDLVVSINDVSMASSVVVARDGDQFVAMATLCPPLPPARKDARAPLALKILVDCSGSMGGDSIGAARQALHRILEALQFGDRVTYSRFGSQVVHDTPVPLTISGEYDGLHRLSMFVSRTDANLGGTEMRRALESVFALGDREASAVLLITDGETWDVPQIIEAARTASQKVFVVGIGAAPAEGLLRRVAEDTGGACEFVAPGENVQRAVLRLFSRLRAPRVQQVRVRWPGNPTLVGDVPATLFEGETLHLFARWDDAPQGEASLAWTVDDARVPETLGVTLPARIQDDDTLARLFGARQVAAAALAGDSKAATALAVKYQLVSDYTNYLVVHARAEGEKAVDLPRLNEVPQMLAAGWGGHGSVHAGGEGVIVRSWQGIQSPPTDDSLCYSMPARESRAPDQTTKIRAFRSVNVSAHDRAVRANSPAELLDVLWQNAKIQGGVPTDLRDVQLLVPDDASDWLDLLATEHGPAQALRLFYAALLALSRQGVGERELQRHLSRAAGNAVAPVVTMTATDWGWAG